MTFPAGLTHDPENEDLKDGWRRASAEVEKLIQGDDWKEVLGQAVADPEVRAIMTDPVIQQLLSECTSNPAAAAAHLRVAAAKVQKLVDAGILD